MSLVPWESTVRVFYSRFHSRFAPGFAPDSRSNSISLHHTSSGRFPHSFNANIAHGPTPSHSIPIPTDRPFKAKTESSAHAFPSSCLPQAFTWLEDHRVLHHCTGFIRDPARGEGGSYLS